MGGGNVRGQMHQRRAAAQLDRLDRRQVKQRPFIVRINIGRRAAREMANAPAGPARRRREGAADKARTAGQRQQGSAGAHRTASMRSCGTNISSR